MSEADVIRRSSKPANRESLAADLKELGLGKGQRVIVTPPFLPSDMWWEERKLSFML